MEIKLYIIVSIASRCRFKKYPAAVETRILTAVFFGLKFQNLGTAVLQGLIYSYFFKQATVLLKNHPNIRFKRIYC